MPFIVWQERRRVGVRESSSAAIGSPTAVTPLDVPPSVSVPHAVLDALRAIQTTRYEHSFTARAYGHTPQETPGLIAVDIAHGRHFCLLCACTVSRRIYIRVHSYRHADRLL